MSTQPLGFARKIDSTQAILVVASVDEVRKTARVMAEQNLRLVSEKYSSNIEDFSPEGDIQSIARLVLFCGLSEPHTVHSYALAYLETHAPNEWAITARGLRTLGQPEIINGFADLSSFALVSVPSIHIIDEGKRAEYESLVQEANAILDCSEADTVIRGNSQGQIISICIQEEMKRIAVELSRSIHLCFPWWGQKQKNVLDYLEMKENASFCEVAASLHLSREDILELCAEITSSLKKQMSRYDYSDFEPAFIVTGEKISLSQVMRLVWNEFITALNNPGIVDDCLGSLENASPSKTYHTGGAEAGSDSSEEDEPSSSSTARHKPLSGKRDFAGETETMSVAMRRVGQDMFRKGLLDYWENRCSVTGVGMEQFLKASHIKPWAKCTDKERLDIANGLLLCPCLDTLFDGGYISFKSTGKILISCMLPRSVIEYLKRLGCLSLRHVQHEHQEYLEYHRFYEFKP